MAVLRDDLAHFSDELTFKDLHNDLVEYVKLCILDQIGVCIAGPNALTESFGKIDEFHRQWRGREESTVIGSPLKLPCPSAVWLNTAYATATSMDAIHKSTMIHLPAGLVPALIATAEWKKSTGKKLIEAFVVGSEVGIRVGCALGANEVYALGFHPSCCANPFACAVGVGKILGLKEKEIAQAISIAAIQAGGLYLTGGAESHAANYNLAIAMSSESGVKAALYASMGMTGFAQTFEHERGFLSSHSKRSIPEKLVSGLGDVYEVKNLCFKKYSVGIYEATSVETLIYMFEKYVIQPSDIKEIILKLPTKVMRTVGAPEYPANRQRAYTNPRFIISLVSYYGEDIAYDAELFGTRGLNDTRIKEMYNRIKVEGHEELDRIYPDKKPCIVEIRTKKGDTFIESNEGPFKGDPDNPFTATDFVEKFERMTSKTLNTEKQFTVIEVIKNLEEINDVSDLFGELK